MKRISVLACVFVILGGCRQADNPEFQRIEKTGKLPGIVEIRLNKDGTVTMKRGQPHLPIMLDDAGKPAEEVTLKPGEKCTVGDGRHASASYQFLSADGDKILLYITTRFDARSFGDGVSQQSKKIWVFTTAH